MRSTMGRICGSLVRRSALVGRRHQHVAVDLAAVLCLAAVDRESSTLPERKTDRETVVIATGRLHLAHLEKRAGAEEAVVVSPVNIAMDLVGPRWRQMQGALGLPAEFRSPIALIDLVVLDDGGRRAHALCQLPEYVVVNQRETDVLVAAALAAGAVDFTQQVEAGAVGRSLRCACSGRRCRRRCARRLGRGGPRSPRGITACVGTGRDSRLGRIPGSLLCQQQIPRGQYPRD